MKKEIADFNRHIAFRELCYMPIESPREWRGFKCHRGHGVGYNPAVDGKAAFKDGIRVGTYTGSFVCSRINKAENRFTVSVYLGYFDNAVVYHAGCRPPEQWILHTVDDRHKFARFLAYEKECAGIKYEKYEDNVLPVCPHMHSANYRYTPVDHPRIPMGAYKPTPTISISKGVTFTK